MQQIKALGYSVQKQDFDVGPLREEISKFKLSQRGREVSAGRIHYELKDSGLLKAPETAAVTAAFSVVCKEFFGGRFPFVQISTVQIVDSYPASDCQCFHSDNAQRGLTFVLALTDIKEESGPTQLIVGSHTLFGGSAGAADTDQVQPKQRSGDAPPPSINIPWLIGPVLKQDELLIFDARLLHRGLGNTSDKMRSIAVFRYDDMKCPPPGMGHAAAFVRHSFGSSVALLYNMCCAYFPRSR